MSLRATGYVRGSARGRVVSFRSSTPDLDRHGTRIMPQGIRTENYDRNPIFLWGHDGYGSLMGSGPSMDSVIGRTIRHSSNKDGWDHDVEFASDDINPKGEMALRMVRAGFLNSTSIGFEPVEWHEETPDGHDRSVQIFDQVDLLEVSLVPIPSNPNAQALARALAGKGMDEFLQGLGDESLAGRVESWVRSAVDAHPTRGEQSSREEPEDEQCSPWADLIRNIEVREYRPSVASQLCRALAAYRPPEG